MDTQLLRKWLGLPPGDWPPDAATLLGDTSAGVQERALDLMERLRPHQLQHPELVTEGMNRLAQALISVESVPDLLQDLHFEHTVRAESDWASFRFDPDESSVKSAPPEREPVVLEAEVVEVPSSAEYSPPRMPRHKRRRQLREPPVAIPSVLPSDPKPIKNRRAGYRRLVRLRSLREAWQKLGGSFGVPSNDLPTSAEIERLLTGVARVQAALRKLGHWNHGTLCQVVLANPALLPLFRDLLPGQRRRLAIDWATALAHLESEEQSLRQSLKLSKPRPSLRQRWRWLRRQPESKLVLTLLFTLLVLLGRVLIS